MSRYATAAEVKRFYTELLRDELAKYSDRIKAAEFWSDYLQIREEKAILQDIVKIVDDIHG